MLYRKFGRTDWDVSVIGQGCWNIGNQWGHMDDASAVAIVRAAYDHGVNLFDVAESYGEPNGLSELRVGKAVAPFRDHVYIVSKIGNWGGRTGQAVPHTTPDMIRLCGHACAGRLGTDRIDVMLCHKGDLENPSVFVEGFEMLVEEGFVREYGISTNRLDVLQCFYDESGGRCAVVEVDYSLVNPAAEDEFLPYCMEKGIAVLVRGPLAKGLLSGRFNRDTVFADSVRKGWNQGASERQEFEQKLAAIERTKASLPAERDLVTTALRYVISHPVQPVAIPGATTVQQAVQNAEVGAEVLSQSEREDLRQLIS